MKSITAQDVYNLTTCAHRVYLDANGDARERGDVGPFVKLLWDKGLQTEREYLSLLRDLPVSDLKDQLVEEASESTLRLMKEGVPLIYQGCLVDGRYIGRPDLLLKDMSGKSVFGSYRYEPIDIKAGKGWEERDGKKTKFKEHYAFQIMFYRMLLQRIQGDVPSIGRIVNVNKEFEEFNPADFETDFREALGEAERLVDGQEMSEPVLGGHCQLCPWYVRCAKWVNDNSDPTGLFFVGKQKFQMKQVGLGTIKSIADMNVADYLKPPKKIRGLAEKSLSRMKERAQVMLECKPRIRQGYTFPEKASEIYFDIEDDPTRGTTYLFGLLVKEKGGEPAFRYFLARDPSQEEETVRAFWEFLRTADDVVYYVYSHKERTTLSHLQERYGLDTAVIEKYLANEFDLYQKLVVDYSDWPTYSYGIKQIARLIGFEWRDPDPSGANSIVWYNEFLANPANEAPLNRIIAYNEDDCRAMVRVKEYFVEARSNANYSAVSNIGDRGGA